MCFIYYKKHIFMTHLYTINDLLSRCVFLSINMIHYVCMYKYYYRYLTICFAIYKKQIIYKNDYY